MMRKIMWIRILIVALISLIFGLAWHQLEKIAIQVVGQPSTTGYIRDHFEQPFFEHLATNTGLPLEITYKPNDELGIKDNYQLLMLKSGALELVSLRFLQNAPVEPKLLGLDLSGAAADIDTARAVADAYGPLLDQELETHFNSKLLGLWPFGPQVFFCRKPVQSVKDLAGLKVRVGSENFTSLIKLMGAQPVVIPFEDVKSALRTGLVDCAITSATSGNAAGWPEHATHFFNLGLQMGINGYVINRNLWNSLSSHQQQTLELAFQRHVDAIWKHTADVHQDMVSCNIGGPCEKGVQYHLINASPSQDDYRRVQDAFENTTFKDWAAKCDAIHPGCSQQWREVVAPILQAGTR